MRRGERIAGLIEQALEGRVRLAKRSPASARRAAGATPSHRAAGDADNDLSDRFTVIEVECLDRHGLLYDLTHAISELSLDIASAHIATFGERVVDTFYVTDLVGHKVTAKARQNRIRRSCSRRSAWRRRQPAARKWRFRSALVRSFGRPVHPLKSIVEPFAAKAPRE